MPIPKGGLRSEPRTNPMDNTKRNQYGVSDTGRYFSDDGSYQFVQKKKVEQP